MYKRILESSNLEILGLFALVFFFAFFVYASWKALKMTKSQVKYAETLPLIDNEKEHHRR